MHLVSEFGDCTSDHVVAIDGSFRRAWVLRGLVALASYLTKKWRVLYVVEGDRFEVLVLEVNPHAY